MQKIQAENTITNKARQPRPIRSFVRRARKLPPKKQQVVDQIGEQYILSPTQNIVDFTKIFGREASLIIEIGFGTGENLLHLAQTLPHYNFLGIEVHKPGVAAVLMRLQQELLNNIRIYEYDAVEIFKQCIADNSVDKILLYFPDPWPKNRHHKRRIIQKEFVELIAAKLKCGGELRISTDCDDYADHCRKILSTVREFANANGETALLAEPFQCITTKFKRRGLKSGHNIWDMVFVKKVL
jgi:tRNA (guanine-N7-)-methyltransferase